MRVFKGGAERGTEIAALQYVNNGAAACTISGIPSARLLVNGTPAGTRSQPDDSRVRTMTLQPGDTAQSLLRDFSSCNAPLAHDIRVSLPSLGGSHGGTVDRPISPLRVCALRTSPVGPPS